MHAMFSACLKALDQYPGKIGNTNAIELALWYHDAVYDPEGERQRVQSAKLLPQRVPGLRQR